MAGAKTGIEAGGELTTAGAREGMATIAGGELTAAGCGTEMGTERRSELINAAV